MASMENVSPATLTRLSKELKGLMKNAIDDIKIVLSEEDITDFVAEIKGPEGTPYAGGVFRVKFLFGPEFPTVPPKGVFLTKIFHPNVSKSGEICVNTLKRDWQPNHTLRHVLMVIRCLLIEPYPESALNEDAGKLLLEDYAEYAKRARLMTSIHATPTSAEEAEEATTEKPSAQSSTASSAPSKTTKTTAKSGEKKKAAKKNLRRL